MRTWMRLRLASTQPNTASHTIRKRESSSVQISGSPRARVTTPSATQTRSEMTSPQATIAAAPSKPRTNARSIGFKSCADRALMRAGASRSSRGDALPEALAPLRHELGGDARQDRLAETFQVRLDHGHASGLERVGELALLRKDLGVLRLAMRIDGRLQNLSVLGAQRLPRGLVDDDEPRRDDVTGEHEILLHLVELVALDGRQRILLPVDGALAQREIELADVERRRARAPGLRHRAEGVDLGDAQLESLHVVDRVDRFRTGGEVPLAVVGRADDAHRALGDQLAVHLVDDRRGEHPTHLLWIAPEIRRLEDRELRYELTELRRALVDDLDRAGRGGFDHVSRRAELSRWKGLDVDGAAGLFADLLRHLLHHLHRRMVGCQHRRPAQRGRCAGTPRQRTDGEACETRAEPLAARPVRCVAHWVFPLLRLVWAPWSFSGDDAWDAAGSAGILAQRSISRSRPGFRKSASNRDERVGYGAMAPAHPPARVGSAGKCSFLLGGIDED